VLKGYQGKILRVDLGRQSFREEQLAEPGHPFTPRLLEIAERI
jgi:hypothetical protein